MKKFIALSVVLMSVFYYTNAKADLLLEPYIGYHLNGEVSIEGDDADFSGTSFGGRLGYQNLGFMLGLNFNTGTLEVKDADEDFKYTTYGAFVGFNFPVMLRIWGEYIFGGSSEWGETDFEEFGGYRLGVGFTALPFVSINLEMSQPTMGKAKGSGFSQEIDGSFNSYLLSVSLPITF